MLAAAKQTVTHVLIVDDQELALKQLARDFRREDIEVLAATNHAEALAHAANAEPDVAIIDLFLEVPENGIELIKQLKALHPNMFCILISAHMSVAHALMGVRAGADDVFLKPVSARQALQRMSEGPQAPEPETLTLKQIEWEHIARVLGDYDGNITRAAEALGLYRQSLQRKIQKHARTLNLSNESKSSTSETDDSPPVAPPPPAKPRIKRRRRTKPAPK